MSEIRIWITILVIAAVTAAIRFAPFVLFGGKRSTPAILDRLGKVLPYAVMGMLVVYCLPGVTPFAWPFGLPEFIAIAVVVACHIWKRNTLVSIILGTVSYMLLLHFVF